MILEEYVGSLALPGGTVGPELESPAQGSSDSPGRRS